MSAVSRVTIHHEGAGTPTDVTRGADGGYSIWIGLSRYTILRSPFISFATLRFNHVSLDICLSGDRMTSPVTDTDIHLIAAGVAEARANGWVTDSPEVVAHRFSSGSSTVCPGDHTMARWNDVVAACTKTRPAPSPIPVPSEDDMVFYPYPHPADPNKLSGALIDKPNNRVTLFGNAKIDQATVAGVFWGAPNPNHILTSFVEPDGFAVATADSDLYHLHWV